MQEYFERELKTMENELRWLKTSMVKSGSVVTSKTKSIFYNVPLTLIRPTHATGNTTFRLVTKDTAFFTATLDKYYDDIMKAGELGSTRRRAVSHDELDKNQFIIRVYAWGDENDRQVLSDGSSVTIGGTLTITCTDDFTLEAI